MSTIKIFLPLVHEAAAEKGWRVPDTGVRLPFLKYGYLIGDISRRYEMVIRRKYSSKRQSNMKEEFGEYLQRTGVGLMVIRRAVWS